MVARKTAQTMSMAASIFSAPCKDSEGAEAHDSVMEHIDDCDALCGFLDTASAALFHLPGQYCIVKLY